MSKISPTSPEGVAGLGTMGAMCVCVGDGDGVGEGDRDGRRRLGEVRFGFALLGRTEGVTAGDARVIRMDAKSPF